MKAAFVSGALVLAFARPAWAQSAPVPPHSRSSSSPTRAGDEEARARFEAGRLALEDGRYADALADFRRAYELSGRPALLYNIGIAADRLRHDQEALESFEAYLAALPDAPQRRELEARMQVLRTQLAQEEAREVASTSAPPPPDPTPTTISTAEDAGALSESKSVIEEPWFWVAVVGGALLVGGVVTAVVLTTAPPSTEAPLTGDVGGTIYALASW